MLDSDSDLVKRNWELARETVDELDSTLRAEMVELIHIEKDIGSGVDASGFKISIEAKEALMKKKNAMRELMAFEYTKSNVAELDSMLSQVGFNNPYIRGALIGEFKSS